MTRIRENPGKNEWTQNTIGSIYPVDEPVEVRSHLFADAAVDSKTLYRLKNLYVYASEFPESTKVIRKLQNWLKVTLAAVMYNMVEDNAVDSSKYTGLGEIFEELVEVYSEAEMKEEDIKLLGITDPEGFVKDLVGSAIVGHNAAFIAEMGASMGSSPEVYNEFKKLLSVNRVVSISMLARGKGYGFWTLVYALKNLEDEGVISPDESTQFLNDSLYFAASHDEARESEDPKIVSGISMNAFDRILELVSIESEEEYKIVLSDDTIDKGRTLEGVILDIQMKLLNLEWTEDQISKLMTRISFNISSQVTGVLFKKEEGKYMWTVIMGSLKYELCVPVVF